MYSLTIGLIVPLFKILIERVLSEDIAGFKVDQFFFIPAAFVDILFPVADPYGDDIIGSLCGNDRDCINESAEQKCRSQG